MGRQCSIAVCLALLAVCQVESSCLKWTPWINSDTDPSDGGDFETVGFDSVYENGATGRVTKALDRMGIVCNNPVKIECRDADSKLPWHQAQDDTVFPSRINCDSRRGMVCLNERQADGSCHDYEVRLLCWTACRDLSWTPWANEDGPSGSCDCEHPGWADHPARHGAACPDGQSPVDVDCQTTGGVSAASGPDTALTCDINNGFTCLNDKQPARCQADYRVRYLCFNRAAQRRPSGEKTSQRGDKPIVPDRPYRQVGTKIAGL